MTTAKTNTQTIRPLLGYSAMDDQDVELVLSTVLKGLSAPNPAFAAPNPLPPIDMVTLAALDASYKAAITAAEDGGKLAISALAKVRLSAIHTLKQLGAYVEANCNGDMAIFVSSGFQPVPTTRTPAQPLTVATIRKVNHGVNSGQLMIIIAALAGALSYELRSATAANAAVGTWTVQTITSVRAAVSITGLIPGTVYAFQVRALGKVGGYTDWSDTVSCMST